MLSSVVPSKKTSLLVIFALAFLFTFSAAFRAYDQQASSLQNRNYDTRSSGPMDNLADVLDEAGLLNIVKNLVPAFEEMISGVDKLFEFTDKQHHAAHLNKVLGHLKGAWPRAIDRAMDRAAQTMREKFPEEKIEITSQYVTPKGFTDFVETYKNLFSEAVNKDKSLANSDVIKFLDIVNHFFVLLETAYAGLYYGLEENKIPILPTWQILSVSKFLVMAIPTNVLDAQALVQFMSVPKSLVDQMSTSIKSFSELLKESPYGMYVPIAIQFLENSTKYLAQQLAQQQDYTDNRGEL